MDYYIFLLKIIRIPICTICFFFFRICVFILFLDILCVSSKKLTFSSIFIRNGNVATNIQIICFSLKLALFKEGLPITKSLLSLILYIYVERAVKNSTYGDILFLL